MLLLAQLPENRGLPIYSFDAEKYARFEHNCSNFLEKLYEMREERNI